MHISRSQKEILILGMNVNCGYIRQDYWILVKLIGTLQLDGCCYVQASVPIQAERIKKCGVSQNALEFSVLALVCLRLEQTNIGLFLGTDADDDDGSI